MYHLSDNELDRLSREASEQFEAEQNASGWEALEQKLDKELPITGRKRRRWFFFIPLAALIVITIPVYIYFHSKSYQTADAVGPAAPQRKTATVPAQQSPSTENDGLKDERPKNRADNPASVIAKKENEIPAARTNGTSAITKPGNNGNKISTIKAPNSQSPINSGSATIPGRTKDISHPHQLSPASGQTNTSVVAAKQDGISMKGTYTAEATAVPVLSALYPLHSTGNHVLPDSIHYKDLPDGQNMLVKAEKIAAAPSEKSQKSHGLIVGLLAGSDFSNVNFSMGDHAGFNIGVTAAYTFSKRWSVNTGLIYTMKRYMAAAEDYHPPKGTWTYYIDLDEVAGDCSMYEIPLTLRYDLYAGKKLKIFVNSGLSTYLMHKETYNYFYTYNGEYTNRERSYITDDKFWFSIADLSGGIEKSFSKKMTLQVEPYLKMPVKGIGFGNVKLNSYGINFSLRYHLSQK